MIRRRMLFTLHGSERMIKMKRWMITVLVCALLLSGCGAEAGVSSDLMVGIKANAVSSETSPEGTAGASDFGIRLLRECFEEGENVLISPLSVLSALAMTANGADGETLAQMEEVMGLDCTQLNGYLSAYMSALPENEYYKLSMANAIWYKDDPLLTVYEDFLQTNADYYQAGIYKAPFDEGTEEQINQYVQEHTDGLIPEILDEIPEEAVMYLVNALAFDAQWNSVYEQFQIRDGIFTAEDGNQKEIELMYSTEYAYLEDDFATGVMKYFRGTKYAFAALLPNEGVSVEDYLQTLDGQHLHELLREPQNICTYTRIPRFETEYSVEMSDILEEMGMQNAFDWKIADFSRMGYYEGKYICIGRVLHKTKLQLDAQGARAGAATAVEMVAEGAAEPPEDTRTVTLDRPFVYMLIDCENNLPFFIGTMMDMG